MCQRLWGIGSGLWACGLWFFGFAVTVSAGDWPRWRGPFETGHAVDEQLAETWPEAGPPVLWSRELGQGYSSFSIAGDRACTQTQSLYEQSVVCLDMSTGHTLWSQRYGWPYDGGGLYPGPRATPVIAEGRVYFVAPHGLLGCLDLETGRSIWSRNLKEELRGKGTDFGVSASPVIWQQKLFVPVGSRDGSLVAVDAATGELLWKCGELPASYATPIVVPWAARWLVIAPLENSLLCADANTGERLWELDLSQGYDEHSAALIYDEPYLFMAGPFRSGGRCWKLVDTENGCRPERVWETQQMSNDVASSVRVDSWLFGFDLKDIQSRLHRPSRGEFRCLDWTDGKVLWSSTEPGHANIIVADGKLLLFNDRGELRLARISGTGYEELACAEVFPNEVCWTAPALSQGRLLLRQHQRVVCLSIGAAPPDPVQSVKTLADVPRVQRFNPTVLLGGEREFPAGVPDRRELWFWFKTMCLGLATAWAIGGLAAVAATWLQRRHQQSRRLDEESAVNPNTLGLTPPRFVDAVLNDIATPLRWRWCAGFLLIIVWGAAGSWWYNLPSRPFLFTWPLAVWALLQAALDVSWWAVTHRERRWAGWAARGSLLLLIAGWGVYFHFCRQLGLAIEWVFLTGGLWSTPVDLLSRGLSRSCRGPATRAVCRHLHEAATLGSFFWVSVWFMEWWCVVGS